VSAHRPADLRGLKLLATDLDGTLLHSDGTVSAYTRMQLDRAAAAGFPVVAVTGRPIRWLPVIAEASGLTGLMVAANGALLYDVGTDTIVAEHPLTPEQLQALTADLREHFPAARLAIEYGFDFGYEPAYHHEWAVEPELPHPFRGRPKIMQAELADLVSRPAVKVLARDPDADPDRFLAEVSAVVGDQGSPTRSGISAMVEIAAPGVTKASGLAAVARQFGVGADQVVAIGDMSNDIPMLQWAGYSVAVGNAHTDVRDIADTVTVTNDEDAVGRLLSAVLDAAA
jgi:Cof subfamily protein (haloacid dehalogenase superfamily)